MVRIPSIARCDANCQFYTTFVAQRLMQATKLDRLSALPWQLWRNSPWALAHHKVLATDRSIGDSKPWNPVEQRLRLPEWRRLKRIQNLSVRSVSCASRPLEANLDDRCVTSSRPEPTHQHRARHQERNEPRLSTFGVPQRDCMCAAYNEG